MSVKIFAARGDFGGDRIPVVWRSALDHVGDVHLVPAHADTLEQILQKVPGGTNERPPLAIFMEPRPFADEHYFCGFRAFSWYGVGSAGV